MLNVRSCYFHYFYCVSAYCNRTNIKPLSTADFGKVMKQVFPNIRPRRLGTRGNSRYCYAAMRKATKLEVPSLPDLSDTSTDHDLNSHSHEEAWHIVRTWAENSLGSSFTDLGELAVYLNNNKQKCTSGASVSSKQLIRKKLGMKHKINVSSIVYSFA